jgi:hypothetical protein
MDVDLDIDNYELEDLLNLFKLSYDFSEEDLKKVKKQVLKTHPDKSKLDKIYFLFFTKAYKMISQVYYFRGKKQQKVYNVDYITDDKEHVELIKGLNGKSITEFNKWFNKMFDSVKLLDDERDTGYGDWMKEEVEEVKKVNLNDFEREFNKKKSEGRELAIRKDVNEVNNTSGTNLSRDKLECYNSSIFSKLNYEDLKRAHTETVVPVTEEDYEKKMKFNNMDDLIKYRGVTRKEPLSIKESKDYLKEKEESSSKTNMNRAYKLLKRDEELEQVNEKWWKNFRLLK